MKSSKPEPFHSETYPRLKLLTVLRVFLVSLLLGASIIIQIQKTQTYFGPIQTSHYLLIAGVYLLTIIYALLLKYNGSFSFQAYLQFCMDSLFVTGLIYITGGIESIFSL